GGLRMFLFRERLKDLREELHLDQKQMGKKLNISPSAYGYYEQGRNEPSLETLVKIAKIFNVTTDYLLGITNTCKHTVYYSVSDKISLTNDEMDTLLQLKETSLLNELSEKPRTNTDRLNRYWQFIKHEHNHK